MIFFISLTTLCGASNEPPEQSSYNHLILARVVNFMDLAKRKSLMKAFITFQFNNCPQIWMFHSRQFSGVTGSKPGQVHFLYFSGT